MLKKQFNFLSKKTIKFKLKKYLLTKIINCTKRLNSNVFLLNPQLKYKLYTIKQFLRYTSKSIYTVSF